MIRQILLVLAGITISSTTICAELPESSRLPRFLLEDQYERTWKHTDFTTSLVVYVISDRDGYEYCENWTKPLIQEYGKRIRFVPIADVRGVPGFLKGYIRGRFKAEFKYPILLDWQGTIATSIAFTTGYPNLLIVDTDRTILHIASGAGTVAQVRTFGTRLQRLLDR